jgi:hypothetical protein
VLRPIVLWVGTYTYVGQVTYVAVSTKYKSIGSDWIPGAVVWQTCGLLCPFLVRQKMVIYL